MERSGGSKPGRDPAGKISGVQQEALAGQELRDGSSCLDKGDRIVSPTRARHCSSEAFVTDRAFPPAVPPLSLEAVRFYPAWEKQVLADGALPG